MQQSNTKIAIIMQDYSTMGGVEVVTNHLVNTELPIWGIIGYHSQKNTIPDISYPSHIELYTIKNIDDIIKRLKENNITHTILQIFNLKDSINIINKLKENNIKSIFFLHNTPHIFFHSLSYNKSLIWKIKVLIRRIKYSTSYSRIKNELESVIDSCDKFLVLSENIVKETKHLVAKKYHSKINYIYNTIPLEFTQKPFSKKKNSIVFGGRLTKYKGVLFAVKTLAPLLKKHLDWHFYILGGGEYYNDIQIFIRENNIKNIHLCGKVNNVYEYLNDSKICLLYSLFEGLPTILLEAGYHNNVLISYNSKGGVSDIIQNNTNGFIVNNTKELYKKIEYLINNPEKIEQIAMNNKLLFDKFNRDKVIKKWKYILGL